MIAEIIDGRMNNPEDVLIKLASTLFGKLLHGYLNSWKIFGSLS